MPRYQLGAYNKAYMIGLEYGMESIDQSIVTRGGLTMQISEDEGKTITNIQEISTFNNTTDEVQLKIILNMLCDKVPLSNIIIKVILNKEKDIQIDTPFLQNIEGNHPILTTRLVEIACAYCRARFRKTLQYIHRFSTDDSEIFRRVFESAYTLNHRMTEFPMNGDPITIIEFV